MYKHIPTSQNGFIGQKSIPYKFKNLPTYLKNLLQVILYERYIARNYKCDGFIYSFFSY